LDENKIKYRENDDHQWTDSIPIHKFKNKLWNMIKLNKYNDNEFVYDDGYPDKIKIMFSSNDRVIYQCKPGEDYKELINNLRYICRKINSELLQEIDNYNMLKKDYESKINNLINKLINITYTPQLRIKDNSYGSIKCDFIT
jgi:hypothetical protein